MMTSIENTFKKLKSESKCALIPFIVAGDPDLLTTKKAIYTLVQEGANIIELGIPYSDPLADGPTIQAASTRAIRHGIKLSDILDLVSEVSKHVPVPFVAFTYYNLILNYTVALFVKQIADAGFQGLIVPDLPLEETDELFGLCRAQNIDLILLISPNTSKERISQIATKSQGCIYLVSSTGVTGAQINLNQHIQNLVYTIKETTDTPVILGFGISKTSEVKAIKSWGLDGIVVGSAFVNTLLKESLRERIISLQTYCREIKKSLQS